MKGAQVNIEGQPKVLSLSPNGSGGVRIYSSLNLTNDEKLDLLHQAIEHLNKGKLNGTIQSK
jgi:hypothetical protein